MRDDAHWRRLARYLAGESAPEERRAVEAWIEADPSRRSSVAVLRRLWGASAGRPAARFDSRQEADEDWARLAAKMRAAERSAAASGRPPVRRRTRRHRAPLWQGAVARVAVALVVLMGSVLLVVRLGGWWSGTPQARAEREIVTERGERSTLQLADGTEVTLNVDSRLRLASTFNQQQRVREVYLQGEAYFDVATDAGRPFVVHAGAAVVNVEGTAFGVKAYPEEPGVQVVVAEGAVSLRAEQESAEQAARLERGELGRLSEGEPQVATERVDAGAYLSWTEGRLVFERAALPEVAARLERWYDVRCEIQDPALADLHLTAALNSRSLRDVLEVITASLGIDYRIEGGTVVFMSR